MREKDSAVCGSATSLEVRYTGKPVSGWGGLVAVMRYLENLGVGQVLAQALPDGRTCVWRIADSGEISNSPHTGSKLSQYPICSLP